MIFQIRLGRPLLYKIYNLPTHSFTDVGLGRKPLKQHSPQVVMWHLIFPNLDNNLEIFKIRESNLTIV